MDDRELDQLINAEALERSLRVTEALQRVTQELALSLENAAAAFDRASEASLSSQDRDGQRRSEFRRLECPGRFE